MTIPEILAKIRTRAESKQVECPGDGVVPPPSYGIIHALAHCTRCQDEGHIPNPAYAPMLNVARVKCGIPDEFHHNGGCFLCKETPGFMLRSWDGLPPRALAGALQDACEYLPWWVNWGKDGDRAWADVFTSTRIKWITTARAPTVDEAVALAVLEAMEKSDERAN